jgi:hypothetical protein
LESVVSFETISLEWNKVNTWQTIPLVASDASPSLSLLDTRIQTKPKPDGTRQSKARTRFDGFPISRRGRPCWRFSRTQADLEFVQHALSSNAERTKIQRRSIVL